MERIFLLAGSLLGGLGVALGAFGAHGLKGRLSPEDLAIFETGVRYQMYHALALLAVAYAAHRWPEAGSAAWAGWLMLAGTLIFSGTLYLLVLSGLRWLGAITPIGGVLLILGWLSLVLTAWNAR